MRVALVASLVSPIVPAEANGPHAVIGDLARGLGQRGHDVMVYAADGSMIDGAEVMQIPVDAAAGGASFSFEHAASAEATSALNRGYARLFAQLRHDEPDAVSQHAFDAAAIDLANGLPALHTLHLPPIDVEVVAALRRSDAPRSTPSDVARLAWEQAGVPGVTVLRNGVPTPDPMRGPVLPVALVAGRISPEKGTDAAIRVARRAGLAVLLAGDVYDRRYFGDTVEPMLRPGEWIGPVPRGALFELMAHSAVLLMPVRRDETFGLVAAEAQMVGCPVVGYRRGALHEIVRQGQGGWLVDPGDEDALAAAVFSARGLDRSIIRRRARAELGVDRMVDDYEHALLHVAA